VKKLILILLITSSGGTVRAGGNIPFLLMPIPEYRANAVYFDGTTDYLTRGAGLTGAADSKMWTFSFWARRDAVGPTVIPLRAHTSVGGGSGTHRTRIQWQTSNEAFVTMGSKVGSASSTCDATYCTLSLWDEWVPSGATWRHFLVSVDMSSTGKRHVYTNDVSSIDAVNPYSNQLIDFTYPEWAVGGYADGSGLGAYDIADVMVWVGTYVDFSVAANRRKFISATGKPVDPKLPGGAIETLGAPIVGFFGPTATWHQNTAGTGGAFTSHGTLTTATTSPSD
jgi:hypothetical protein